jgi:hypothetical protein
MPRFYGACEPRVEFVDGWSEIILRFEAKLAGPTAPCQQLSDGRTHRRPAALILWLESGCQMKNQLDSFYADTDVRLDAPPGSPSKQTS